MPSKEDEANVNVDFENDAPAASSLHAPPNGVAGEAVNRNEMKNKTPPKPFVDEQRDWYSQQIADKKREKFLSLVKLVLSLGALVSAVLLYFLLETAWVQGPLGILGGIIVFIVFDICLYGFVQDRKELIRLHWMAQDFSYGSKGATGLPDGKSPDTDRGKRRVHPLHTPRI